MIVFFNYAKPSKEATDRYVYVDSETDTHLYGFDITELMQDGLVPAFWYLLDKAEWSEAELADFDDLTHGCYKAFLKDRISDYETL